jgi:arginine N-succinyltransferase
MLIVRPAKIDDLDSFLELKRQAGPGFTSLAVEDSDLEQRLHKSVKSFANPELSTKSQIYLLMLEDGYGGEVVGVSAVKSLVGMEKPFFSFKVLNIIQSSSVANRHFDMQVMLLVNEYSGTSEVGTLFVKSKMRGTGAGRLISQARYMLIAGAPDRFSEKIISELRGKVDAKGYSPFWESLGRKFFKMDFNEADKITAETDNQFITDLMPKYPIYTELLSPEAQEVIGQTHPDGGGARRLLEAEGFRYENCVDIFDAGPTLVAPRDQIRTVSESQILGTHTLNEGVHASLPAHKALMSNNKLEDFRAVYTDVKFADDGVCVPEKVLGALHISQGDEVRVFVDRNRKV